MGRIPQVTFVAAMILRLIHFSAHAQTPRSDLDLAFVTDDDASINVAGCDSITAIDERTGDHVFDARQTISPGRIAVSSQAKWIASTSSNTGAFIVLLNQLGLNSLRWSTSKIAAPIVLGGPLAFAPNDTWLLVAGRGQVMRYDVSRFSASGLGGISGEFVSADTAAILFTRDSSMAIIVHLNESVEFIDPSTMLRNRPTVQYANPLRQIRYTNAAITPDDRFVLITTGGPDINVIDLVAGSTRVVHPDRLGAGYGISINFRSPDRLVAINARTAVIVYRVDDRGDFVEQSRTSVPPQGDVILSNGYVLRHPNAIAWTSDGSGIIAAIGGPKEFRILDYHPGLSAILSHRLDFNACISDLDQELAIDVVTLNDRLPTPSLTPTLTASPTSTPADTPALTPPPPPPTHSPTPTPTPTTQPSPTLTPTQPSRPIYLPLALNEHCTPTQRRTDAVLVIDASTSMLDRDASGAVKLDAAINAARAFIALLDLRDPSAPVDPRDPGDQAALIAFNADAQLLQPLTSDRNALGSAFARIAPSSQTCLVCAVDAAAAELASPRHRDGNVPVVVLLTDGRANPRPAGEAVDAAARAKAAGVTFFTIGLGDDVDDGALEAIAAPSGRYYRAVTADGLAEVYRQVAGRIPCPAGGFWGKR